MEDNYYDCPKCGNSVFDYEKTCPACGWVNVGEQKENTPKFGYLRQDEDSHWYLIPEEYVKLFSKQMDDIYLESDDEKRDNLISEFIHNFEEYRLSGGVQDLRIPMEQE